MSPAPFNEHAHVQDSSFESSANGHAPERAQKLTIADPMDPAQRVPAIVDPASGEVVSALQYARDELHWPELESVVNYSREVPRFALVFDGGRRLLIGGTPDLRSPTKVCDLIADATDKYPPLIKPGEMRYVANALRAIAVVEDHGASPTDETRDWITAYMHDRLADERDLETDAHRAKSVESNTPFYTEDRIYIRSPDFLHYVRVVQKENIKLPALTERLKAIGFTKEPITAPRVNGKQSQREWWWAAR